MPHCVVEYASKLKNEVPTKLLLNAVYQGALKSDLFDPSDIKVRSVAYDDHQAGDVKLNFIHVSLRILDGRTTEQKHSLSNKVLDELLSFGLNDISLTVEVSDIERATYAKKVLI